MPRPTTHVKTRASYAQYAITWDIDPMKHIALYESDRNILGGFSDDNDPRE